MRGARTPSRMAECASGSERHLPTRRSSGWWIACAKHTHTRNTSHLERLRRERRESAEPRHAFTGSLTRTACACALRTGSATRATCTSSPRRFTSRAAPLGYPAAWPPRSAPTFSEAAPGSQETSTACSMLKIEVRARRRRARASRGAAPGTPRVRRLARSSRWPWTGAASARGCIISQARSARRCPRIARSPCATRTTTSSTTGAPRARRATRTLAATSSPSSPSQPPPAQASLRPAPRRRRRRTPAPRCVSSRREARCHHRSQRLRRPPAAFQR